MVSDSKSQVSLALGGAALAALGVAIYYKFSKTPKGDFKDIHSVTKEQLSDLLDEVRASCPVRFLYLVCWDFLNT